ncbi:HTH-type transcriptional activator RhaS [Mariniflexile rhizosphaerae]|uniref:AraC family transcriptional regulator n=1 Tax=unclassified Mariniflexile TaxID=2643887 RepID=UPI000CB4CEC4|nr:AraC family transcriptional regulator [Mariniflexile sp. TRM1-10]AXP80474.1 HTH-type transcriptional activator RhaS [Mariniflexile sp. TRM1-10]PLB20497.1 MAG: Transcriptional regulator [Flavobacteriaceae bacterium FS1-H7996/R]
MINKKPTFRKLTPSFGSSILVKQHVETIDKNGAYWHFHPELELIYINKGQGKTHIGNHLSYFNNSQLILIGSNLPHNGFTDRLTANGTETAIQFKSNFLGDDFLNVPEMAAIVSLFDRAKKGIRFKVETKQKIGPKIEKLLEHGGLKRVLKFLEILEYLATTDDYTLLNADGFAFEAEAQDSSKIDIIFKYVNKNFQNHITLDEIADEVSMTVPAFCRYFKKATGKTFTQLVNEYRVVHATKLLNESQKSIADICFECGFNNFSHFNKQFNEITGKSASNYRKEIKLIIQ